MPGSSSWMPCAPQGVKGLDYEKQNMHISFNTAPNNVMLEYQHIFVK
jgi:hypothetical protein